MPQSNTTPDPKAPDMPTMPADEAADMGPQGVMNESTGGYGVAHDADPQPPVLQRPDGKGGLGAATPVALAQAYLPSALVPPPAPLPMTHTGPGQIPQKPLGHTGVNVSIIGLGGSSLGDASSLEEAVQIVHEAVDAGVTFMDNAWEYNNHRSEDWMGRALQGRRDKVFLMTKVCTHGRDKKVAMQQLEVLPRYLGEWKDRVQKDKVDAKNRKRFLDTILIKVNDLVSRWFAGEQENHSSHDLDFGSEILFSVCVLGESLDWSMKMIYEDFDAKDVMMPAIVELFTIRELSPRSLTLHSRMVDDGWCPSYIMFVWKNLGASGLYACYLIGPPAKRRVHINCLEHRCLIDQVDEKKYETVHVLPRTCCSHIIPDTKAVRDIVECGGIPLISISTTQEDLDIKVVAHKSGTPYIAISHVWSDGLGNVDENSLPICQLQRLGSKIRTSLTAFKSLGISYGPFLENDGRLYIWMDTLCVPLTPMSSRKSAIAKMKSYYSEAAIVWVLDASIKQLSITDDLEKILLRMATSQWLKRLWTLQEGAFARALIFETMEAGLPITNLFTYWKEQEAENIHNRLPWVTSALVTSFLALPDLEAGKRFIAMCEQVRWRSTSRSTDEPICLATVLGLDVTEILGASDDRKMIKFLHLQRMFLSDVLFWKIPRLHIEGYRWAPRSFLSRPSSTGFRGGSLDAYGFCHKFGHGLMSTFAGFVFPAGQNQVYQRFYEKSTRDQYTWWMDEVSGNPGGRVVLGVALVLRSKNPFSSPFADTEDGVLVSIWHKEPGVLFAHYLMRVQVRKIVEGSAEDLSATIPDVLTEGMPDCSAEFVGDDQKWCVG